MEAADCVILAPRGLLCARGAFGKVKDMLSNEKLFLVGTE